VQTSAAFAPHTLTWATPLALDMLGGHNGAGRPVSSRRWRLGPARFGSYRKPMGVWGCFHIYRPSSVPRFRPRKM